MDILVDFRERFSVTQVEALQSARLAGLNESYQRAFTWRLTLRASRVSPPQPVPPFKLRTIPPEADEIRSTVIDDRFFDLPLEVDEGFFKVSLVPGLALTHYYREGAGQHWWKADWRGLEEVQGYGLNTDAAVEHLVRSVRRLVAGLPSFDETEKRIVRARLEKVGLLL